MIQMMKMEVASKRARKAKVKKQKYTICDAAGYHCHKKLKKTFTNFFYRKEHKIANFTSKKWHKHTS